MSEMDMPIDVAVLEGVSAAPQYSAGGTLNGYRWFAFHEGQIEEGDAENEAHGLHRARRRLDIMKKHGPRCAS